MARPKGLTVPRSRSEEEEIEFWKSHDVEDYLTGEVVSVESIFGTSAGRGSRTKPKSADSNPSGKRSARKG